MGNNYFRNELNEQKRLLCGSDDIVDCGITCCSNLNNSFFFATPLTYWPSTCSLKSSFSFTIRIEEKRQKVTWIHLRNVWTVCSSIHVRN